MHIPTADATLIRAADEPAKPPAPSVVQRQWWCLTQASKAGHRRARHAIDVTALGVPPDRPAHGVPSRPAGRQAAFLGSAPISAVAAKVIFKVP